MSRTYYIELNSVIVSTPDGGAEIAEPGTTQVVHGHKIHYKAHQDVLFAQVLNDKDEILYSAPAHNVKFIWSPTKADEPKPSPEARVLQLIQPVKEDEAS